jgi:hypothetical protein
MRMIDLFAAIGQFWVTNSWISREAAMTRRLLAIATVIVVTSGCAHAQVGMGTASPNSGMGATSPLGMSTSGGVFAPTGIPLGAAPLATPGVSSGSSIGACSPISTVVGNAMNSTAPFSGDGVGVFGVTPLGPTGTFPTSSNTGLSTNMCGQAPAAGSTASSQSSTSSNATSSNATSQLGVPTIPMGSTELSNPGLSPAPCPSTSNTALSTSSGAC